MKDFKTKDIKNSLKDVDDKGVISLYASAFGNKDSDGDIISHKAFNRTLNNNARLIKHYHGP